MRGCFGIVMWLTAQAAAAGQLLPLVCDGSEQPLSMAAGSAESIIDVQQAGHWLLRIDEHGQDLRVQRATDTQFQDISLRPPRYGATGFSGNGAQRIVVQSISLLPSVARVSCRLIADGDTSARCFADAETAFAVADVDTLVGLAKSDQECATFAQHSLATLQSRASRFQQARDTAVVAQQMWLHRGEPIRAAAARLGIAEDYLKGQQFVLAVAEAKAAEVMAADYGAAYFAHRAQVTQASALREWGRSGDAKSLLIESRRGFERLGELGEVVNILTNLARIQLADGDLVGALRSADAAAAIPSEQLTPMVQGRLALLMIDLQPQQSSIAESLRLLHESEAMFALAGQRYWQEIALRRRAYLLSGLGMHAEANLALAAAFRMSTPKETPVRVADALVEFGRLRASEHLFADAERWNQLAADIYSAHAQAHDHAWASLNAQWALLRRGERVPMSQLEQLLDGQEWLRDQPLHVLSVARALMADQRVAEAYALLKKFDCARCTFAEQVEFASAIADAMVASGKHADALTELASRTDVIRSNMLAQTRGALRFLALRQLRALADSWIAAATQSPLPIPARDWWRMAMLTHPYVADSEQVASAAPDYRFSDLIAAPLLGRNRAETADEEVATKAMIARLSRLGGAAAAADVGTDLASVQASLPLGTELLTPMLGNDFSAMLWVSRDRAKVVRLPGRDRLMQLATEARLALAAPVASVERSTTAMRALSAALLADADAPRPAQLWMLLHEELAETPLPLLFWSGDAVPVVETMTSSWLVGLEPAGSAPSGSSSTSSTPQLFAISVPDGVATTAGSLAPLPSAKREQSMVPMILRDRGKAFDLMPVAARRDDLLRAFKAPDALVHLATHGEAVRGKFGYSGVWLSPAEGSNAPQFLSWLDIADTELHAGLAVMNACSLADGPSAGTAGSLSFAGAISVAGVDHVVAALWPVSDAATANWVPAFYQHLLVDDLDSTAEALREAQLAMRKSRHFRHPFYWASLAHYRHLHTVAAASTH